MLNQKLCRDLREAINKTNIFTKDKQVRQHFNLLCAVMDRLDSCIGYVNSHSDAPKTEEDLIIFMTFGCIVVDAIHKIFDELGIPYDNDNKLLFKNICMSSPLNLTEKRCPTDDKFFEYFRSLVFAHPFETNRAKFLKDKEKHYSPFVIVADKDIVGVMIYSNIGEGFDSVLNLTFSFSVLKEYIKTKYELLNKAIDRVNQIVRDKENIWKQRNVNRNLPPIETLEDIVNILDERYIDHYEIDEAIKYLRCKTTTLENKGIIIKYRESIIKIIPNICDAIDNMDYDSYSSIINEVINVRPNIMHKMADYQLEKIYCYLDSESDSSNIEWGLTQAEFFAKEFAKKWVKILPRDMEFDEIKLLVSAACYMEKCEQEKMEVPNE